MDQPNARGRGFSINGAARRGGHRNMKWVAGQDNSIPPPQRGRGKPRGRGRGSFAPRGSHTAASTTLHDTAANDGFASGTDDEGYDEAENTIAEEPMIEEPELETPEEREKFYQEVRRTKYTRALGRLTVS